MCEKKNPGDVIADRYVITDILANHTDSTVYLAAGSGYIPQPDWSHGMYQGELKVEGKTFDVSTQEARAALGPLYETLSRYELSTGEVGYGLLENLVVGTYRPHGFNDPGAQAP